MYSEGIASKLWSPAPSDVLVVLEAYGCRSPIRVVNRGKPVPSQIWGATASRRRAISTTANFPINLRALYTCLTKE